MIAKTGRPLLVFLMLFASALAWAQPDALTLKDCIAYGLQNHPSNIVSENDILTAKAKIQEVRSAYLPSVNINGSLDDNLQVQQSVLPGALVGSKEDIRVAFTKKFSTVASAQLDQTLYDQSLITSLKANQYNQQEAQLNKERNEEALVYDISSPYYQVFVDRRQVQFLIEDLDLYKQQLAIGQRKVDKGVMLEVDLNKIQVNYNNTLSQLHVAGSNLTLSENRLKHAMGLPMTDPIRVDTMTAVPAMLLAQADASDFSVTNRTDYKLSEVNISLLTVDEKRIRATALPKLTAYARYGRNGFGDQLQQSISTMNPFSAIGLKLTIPVFDGFKRAGQAKQARYALLNAVENLKIDKAQYAFEFENARTQWVQARSSMENDQRTLALARSVFQTTDLQYQKGVTDLADWLETQRSLKEAQSNYLHSLFKFYLSGVDLEKAKGTLKNFYQAL